MDPSHRVAFVFSGGVSLGAIQVGMLHALYERSIRPDLIVGTSVGAINGAFIAARPPTLTAVKELETLWRAVRREQIFPLDLMNGLRGLFGLHAHLISDSGLRRLVVEHFEGQHFEDVAIPLHVVAVDLLTGQERLLSSGNLIDALMASTAIPGILPTVRWRGRELVDGGVANNTPISHAISLGARDIYVLPAGHACALEHPPASALGMAVHAISLLTHSRLISDIELCKGNAKLVVLPPPCPLSIAPIDFDHATELIERATHDTRVFLDGGGAERAPIRMRMHEHRHPRPQVSSTIATRLCDQLGAG
jgi:NTE family protein